MKRSQRIVLSSIWLATALVTSIFAQTGAEAKPAESPTAGPGSATSAPPSAPEARVAPRSKALQPPDGKWLKDADGREYFVDKVAKHGASARDGESRSRIRGTFSFDVVGRTTTSSSTKVYKSEARLYAPKVAHSKRSPEELEEKILASYATNTPETDRLAS